MSKRSFCITYLLVHYAKLKFVLKIIEFYRFCFQIQLDIDILNNNIHYNFTFKYEISDLLVTENVAKQKILLTKVDTRKYKC